MSSTSEPRSKSGRRAGPTVLVLPNRPGVTHALDCTYVKGNMNGPVAKNNDYVEVPALTIAPTVGRCRVCGGGR